MQVRFRLRKSTQEKTSRHRYSFLTLISFEKHSWELENSYALSFWYSTTYHTNTNSLNDKQISNLPWGSSRPLPWGGSSEGPPQRGSLLSLRPKALVLKPLELRLLMNGWEGPLGPWPSGPWGTDESLPRPLGAPLLRPLELRSGGCHERLSPMSNLGESSFLFSSCAFGCGRQAPWSSLESGERGAS